jgi:ERCC4-type nuclease
MTARLVIDTREQAPLDFVAVPTVRMALKQGDYSVEGLTDVVAVERKSKEDAYGCVGAGRDRFEHCLERLGRLDRAAVVIECSLRRFKTPPAHTRISAAQAIHSYISWQIQYGVPVVWIDSREDAAAWIYRFLVSFVKHRVGTVSYIPTVGSPLLADTFAGVERISAPPASFSSAEPAAGESAD